MMLQPWDRDVPVGADISQTLEELVGQFDLVQRNQLFIYVGLDQGQIKCIYPPSAPHASSNQSDVFAAKCSSF
jgi:hypothetical protein